jgi:hypothetical protein
VLYFSSLVQHGLGGLPRESLDSMTVDGHTVLVSMSVKS